MSSNHPDGSKAVGAAISVEGLGKCYNIYASQLGRIKQMLSFGTRKYYREHWALRDVSFVLDKGESLAILGRNGSGKSTLLQLICGTLTPTRGAVRHDGRIAALLELGAGFNPEFSGHENIYLNGALLGMKRAEIDAKLNDIIAFSEIEEAIDQPVRTYSSGMFVRLAFSVAIHTDPEIMIVDEALSVGDMAFQAKCIRRITEIISKGETSILFVSHDLAAVKAICQKALYLDHGKVVEYGPVSQVCDRYVNDQNVAMRMAPKLESGAKVGIASQGQREEGFARRVAGDRQGSGPLYCVDAAIIDATGRECLEIAFAAKVKLRLAVRSQSDLESACIAFYVKDKNGTEIIGTNTAFDGEGLKDIRAGETYIVDFSFENRFRQGEYYVTVLIADKPNFSTQYSDWINVATTFHAMTDLGRPIWCLYSAPITVDIAPISAKAEFCGNPGEH